jgi:hypothetical protein
MQSRPWNGFFFWIESQTEWCNAALDYSNFVPELLVVAFSPQILLCASTFVLQ